MSNGNKLIENRVVAGFKLIENSVVTGYKKVEDCAVSGYKIVEDTFVDTLFKRDTETIEAAKSRLRNF
jgi:hypothetical protein